jgi:OFA family oxalate/formate antiporter-like MFS transporter
MYSRILFRLGAVMFSIIVFVLLSGGHLLFGFWPSYFTLLFGYGLVFGVAAGFGYGLALSLATGVPDTHRALAIGLVMASFAFSGITLPLAIGEWVASADPAQSFRFIGLACLMIGALIAVYLRRTVPSLGGISQTLLKPAASIVSIEFLRIFLIFFLMCFVGLMLVSQVSGIAAGLGMPQQTVLRSTSAVTLGYLLGSLLGGYFLERAGVCVVLVSVNLLAFTGLLALGVPVAALVLAGAFAVGFTFGSTASIMPLLIGLRFGTQWIGTIYGRLMIAYGLAGVLAPWMSGVLYEISRSYSSALALAASMTAAAVLISFTLRSSKR